MAIPGILGLLTLLLNQLNIASFRRTYFPVRTVSISALLLSISWLFNSAENTLPESHIARLESMPQYLVGHVTHIEDRSNGSFKIDFDLTCSIHEGRAQAISGKVLCYLKHDEGDLLLGDEMVIGTEKLNRIEPPTNPGEFDYARYMANQNIYHRVFLESHDYQFTGANKRTQFQQFIDHARTSIRNSLAYMDDKPRSLAKALLIGQKDDLSQETKTEFSKTGAMHVLAVSGLHVGIIFWILDKVLSFLLAVRFGRQLKLIGLIAGLWLYALLTGLPPSVLRAALMFSIVAFGAQLKRPRNTLSNVLLAAFVIMVCWPNLLFDVGFQLSFSAVFGIIILQPRIANWWRVKNRLLRFIWSITSVSVAAQLATLPITLYYFHQFPTWFLISNLVAIPSAFLVVSGGVILQVLSLFEGQVLEFYQWLYEGFINFFILTIENIGKLPVSHISHVEINLPDVLLIYLAVLTLATAIISKRIRYLKWSLGILILQQLWHIGEKQYIKPKAELVVFSSGWNSVYGLKSHSGALMLTQGDDDTDHGFKTSGFFQFSKQVDSLHLDSTFLLNSPYYSLNESACLLGTRRICFVGKLIPDTGFFNVFIISRRSNFEIVAQLSPEQCVFDSSVNTDWFLSKYPNFAKAHFTQRDGAFLIAE